MAEIRITHTHEDGTLVHGTSRGDGVYELIGPRTAARFRYFPSIKMIGISQSRDHLARRWQIDQAAKALREAGHEVTVEIDDTPRDVTDVKADRAERLDARADRLTTKAERNAAEAERRHAAADAYAERFAGGQPILVGHHSERSARAAQKRIDQNDRAANLHYAKAERAAQAAAVVGKADAYRERPAVIIRRIDRLEAELRQTMHQINGTRPANDWRGKYYAPEAKPAEGDWLEQLTARRTYLEHHIAADREALAEHEANGYVRLSRETVHAGDLVTYWRSQRAEVVRVNPKTVSVKTQYSWTDKVSYEEIKSVECPHEGTTTTIAAAKPAAAAQPRPAPVITAERPAERPAPLRIDARFEFFPTPAGVAVRMATQADLYADGAASMTVLEPSAGNGAIVAVVAPLVDAVDCIELNGQLAERLTRTGLARSVRCADFLEVVPEPVYDRVLMNPPFAGQADIRHVTHALGFLRPGGVLVAVMSAGAEFRTDKTAETFRKLVADRGGYLDALPPDAFKLSGTSVRTVMAVIPAGVPDEGEAAGCSCCQSRSLAGQAHHECARCGHLGKFHVTCNMPPAELTAKLSGQLW